MRKGIAIAGNMIVDFCKEVDSYPKQGMLSNIFNVQKSVGGCLPNTIIDIAKIDETMDLYALGMVGDDENGRYLIDTLNQYNIKTDGVKISGNTLTSFTDVMTTAEDKTRTFFHARGANAMFDYHHIDFSSLSARFFHIGYALLLDRFDMPDDVYGTVMAKALNAARQQGMKTSMDVVSENSNRFSKVVTPSLKYCDFLIINEVEASMICDMPVRIDGKIDKKCLMTVCYDLIEKGINECVVIHAPEASCAMDSSRHFTFAPSLKLPDGYIKGTVGAGDAYCAGILYSLYHGFEMEYALRIGAGAAACNLSELNAIDGMKSLAEIKRVIEKYS
jgi:sugar/nucleoside kinase (ribokinase family)